MGPMTKMYREGQGQGLEARNVGANPVPRSANHRLGNDLSSVCPRRGQGTSLFTRPQRVRSGL